ncbi:hypothetical protein MetMK1DRAFT_00027830 [Metallosphaera yellowstonensis MK1]|uniref:DUF5658 domain-containing protein n=1 Tax=Metallosphaera yellowstonensis MK1 TaxID=671065 RepID=H2C877_9CREN|nr:hypothetical protein [Metallosphaera yellowstonensis]EHP68353.1 hypothetical protein MetMK1DRAFT_00027830 [Metallosphaera yellowstonensis MK1]
MRILKIVWVLFILLNVYDVVLSAVYWHEGNILDEENFFIWIYSANNGGIISFRLALLMAISIKLLFFTGVYWFTRLFDVLKVGKYKWLSLLPFIALSILVDVNNTLIVLYNYPPLF